MDDGLEWISYASHFVADEEAQSLLEKSTLLAQNFPTVWEVINKSTEKNFNGNDLNVWVALVLLYRSLKNDVDHQKIISDPRSQRAGSYKIGAVIVNV